MDGGSFINLDLTTVLLVVIPIALIAGGVATVRWIRRKANDENLFDDD